VTKRGAVLIAAAGFVALAGCKVDATVNVAARADGHGTVGVAVVLDKAAYSQLLDANDTINVADLTKAGWRVDALRPRPDGGAHIAATHPFASPADAERLVAQVGGADGPFTSFHLRHDRSFFTTKTDVDATIDLRQGIDTFTDGRFRELIGGTNIGLDQTRLEQRLGGAAADEFAMDVTVELPGDVRTTRHARLGTVTELRAASTRTNSSVVALVAVSAISTILLIAVGILRVLGRGNRKAISLN
jgi:hypothetical protein